MAISASSSSSLSLCFLRTTFRQGSHSNAPPPLLLLHQPTTTTTTGQFSSLSALHLFNKSRSKTMKAIEREKEENTSQQPSIESESLKTLESNSESSDSVDDDELGTEIQEAMKEKKKKEKEMEGGGDGDFWSGVVEEIGRIEWPAFGKVLGTTGLVLGVIVGSSVVLLTLNIVLAELSDRVFVGRGVQDFFG